MAEALAAERAEAATRAGPASDADSSGHRDSSGHPDGDGHGDGDGRSIEDRSGSRPRPEVGAGRISRLRSDLFDRLPAGGQRVAVELGQHWWLPVLAAIVALALTIAVAAHVRPVAAAALPGSRRLSPVAATDPGTPGGATTAPPSVPSTAVGTAPAPGAAPSVSLLAVPPIAAVPDLSATATTPAVVVVDVAGRVRHPGVVRLVAGSRIVDALRAAGGALPHTDLTPLDLAQPLSDGEQVRVGLPGVPVVAATPDATAPGTGSTGPGSGDTDPAATVAAGPVDLNSATAQALDTLPGIGPVLAARIVAWRTAHGPFESVDDLEDVPGIGPSILGNLRSQVTVGP